MKNVAQCIDVSEEDVAEAMASREATTDLLAHMARVSEPRSGAPKVLLVLGSMATSACPWLDGDLHVEIVGDERQFVVNVFTALAEAMRERVLPPFSFRAPLSELLRALDRLPHLVQPLRVARRSETGILLTVQADVRRSTAAPPAVRVANESFLTSERS